MIGEAVDTAVTLGWALLAWIVLTAVAVGLGLYAVVVAVWAVGLAVWRTACAVSPARKPQAPVSRPQPASCGSRGAGTPPGASQAPSRPSPSWARTDEEAA